MILILIFLPLIGAICAGCFGWCIGQKGAAYITTIFMFITCSMTFFIFYKGSVCHKIFFFKLASWIYSDTFQIDWGFSIDNLTIVMLLVVVLISMIVHLYSIDYMSHDPHLSRFMAYLSLFTFFMLLLVTGDNYVILFLGWEGVGLCSYLLISFWYTRIQANKSAIKALVVNRIADFALTLGIVLIFYVYKSLDFALVFGLTPYFVNTTFYFLSYEIPVLTMICILLFIGAMGKSAQIGLHTWLPDAMEGPTPVSALIHAATMVTAGVFLVIKCSPLFEYVPVVLAYVVLIGAGTAFFSATIGLVQNDIKKVIAYSTCSQLGYMIFACGLSNYHVSVFHLTNHAFFKALLFLSAGAVIHSMSNEQDMRKLGGLLSVLPFTFVMFLIGSLALVGFPFLTGFYSKDLILELSLTRYTLEGSFSYTLGLITAFFTSFYSFRVLYMTFFYKGTGFRQVFIHVHELPKKMGFSLGFLAVGSLFFGYFFRDLFVGLGTDFWNHSIFILPNHSNQVQAEFFATGSYICTEGIIKLLPFYFTIFALLLIIIIYEWFFFWLLFKNFCTAVFIRLTTYLPYLIRIYLYRVYSFIVDSYVYFKLYLIRLYQRDGNFIDSSTIMWYRLYPWEIDTPYFSFERYLLERNLDPLMGDSFFSLRYFAKRSKETIILKNSLMTVGVNPNPDDWYSIVLADKNLDYRDKILYNNVLLNTMGVPPFYILNNLNKLEYISQLEKLKIKFKVFYQFLLYKWYFDVIYNELVNRLLLLRIYDVLFCGFDKGMLEVIGPFGFSKIVFSSARFVKQTQNGKANFYVYFMIVHLLCLLLVIFYLA